MKKEYLDHLYLELGIIRSKISKQIQIRDQQHVKGSYTFEKACTLIEVLQNQIIVLDNLIITYLLLHK